MPTPLQSLFASIVDDDHVRARTLIAENPGLARQGLAAGDCYEPDIAHWIYTGDSALHVAAAGYRVEIARMLLAGGADAGGAGNRRGGQPLHYAADGCPGNPGWSAARQVAMIRVLLEAGADLNHQDRNGAAPLHRAVRTRCAAAVACLLGAGADPVMRNNSGSTPFHLAVRNTGRGGSGSEAAQTAQREVIRSFLARGVSPDVPDAAGRSVRDWAASGSIRALLV